MRVIHSLQEEVEKTSDKVHSFVLTNKKGGFYFGSLAENTSKFNGLFFMHNWNMRKIVERIGIPGIADSVTNTGYSYILKKGKAEETFYLNHSNTLVYELQKHTESIEMSLDCRDIYDFSDQGRIYAVKKSKGCIVVEYVKHTDETLSDVAYRFYVAIKTNMECDHIGEWKRVEYSVDAARGSHAEAYIYDAFRCIPQSGRNIVVISYSEKESEAVAQATHIFKNTPYIKRLKKKYANSIVTTPLKLKKHEHVAYQNALLSLDSLITETPEGTGIFAGLPWFFQFWARDEAISSIALLYEERYDLMKEILLRWESHDGRIANRYPESQLGSADATGWIYLRLHQLLLHLSKKKQLAHHFSEKELRVLFDRCVSRISAIEEQYMRDHLIFNKALETWMDTGKDDTRDGFRIEIQALHLACYNFLLFVGNKLSLPTTQYEEKKKSIITAIRKNFYNGSYVFDGQNDPTIRPNAFIAAYIAPEILTKKEWELCFKKLLAKLSVPSGIATIDASSPLFSPTYTGENNASYHRGDSWYWVTALTGIVLNDISPSVFKKEILRIATIVTDEALWSGVPGALSELSSASQQTSSGCASQAWSAALYIELINRLNC